MIIATSVLLQTNQFFDQLLKIIKPQGGLTLAFILAMVGLFIFLIFVVFIPLLRMNQQLRLARGILQSKRDTELSYASLIDELNQDSTYLAHPKLRLIWQKYLSEIRSVEGHPELCPIDEHFSDDAIIHTLGKTQIADMAPGIFTTLGILGTFVGLFVGLQQFHWTNAGALQDSITGLIAGIKIAFQTSIYGISFSLLFSFLYRRFIEETRTRLDDFLFDYGQYVIPNSSQRPFAMLVELQKQETEQMRVFAETFSISMAENLNKTFLPTLERIDTMMTQFVNVASRTQTEGLDLIVNKFVENMNSALGNQFQDLSMQLADINEWQKSVHLQSTELIQKIQDTAEHLTDVDVMATRVINQFSDYLAELKKSQSLASDIFAQASAIATKLGDTIETQKDSVEKMVDIQKAQSENLEQIKKSQDESLTKIQNSLTMFSEKIEESVAQSGDVIDHLTATVDQALKKMEVTINDIMARFNQSQETLNSGIVTAYQKTFEAFDSSLAEIASHLSVTIKGIEDSVDELPSVVQKLSDQTRSQISDVVGRIGQMDGQLNAQLAAVETSLGKFNTSLATWQSDFARLARSTNDLNAQIEAGRKALMERDLQHG